MDSTIIWILCLGLISTVNGQSMDPRVNIVTTSPPSDGRKVRGFISKDVTLDCLVEDLLTDHQVWWARLIKDKSGRNTTASISKDTDINDNNKWSIEKPSRDRWRLRIKALTVEDEGAYWCYVELNRETRVEDWKQVLATDPPLIIEAETTTDLVAKEGEFVSLTCGVSGRPAPTILWRREGNAILPDGGVIRFNKKLDIQSIQYTDRGRYTCEGYNEVGHAVRTITIEVQFPPKAIGNPPKVSQVPGFMRTLSCIVEANPAPNTDLSIDNPQLRFVRNSQTIIQDSRRRINVLEGAHSKITLELQIMEVQQDDYGSYECRAANVFGMGSAMIELEQSEIVIVDKGGETSSAVRTTFSLLLPYCIFWLINTRTLIR